MKLTQFTFFKNTPLIDFQNTIHFNSNTERDNFFLKGNHYETLNLTSNRFNWIRDMSSVVLDVSYNDMRGVNYCTFKSDFENVRYYAYVIEYEYVNENATRVNLLIDGIMTFTQGNVLETLPNLKINREHLSRTRYNNMKWDLKNNDDVLKTNTKHYFKSESMVFTDLLVVIQSAVDLESDFGNKDKPNIDTSHGQRFDKITSPLNLYACDLRKFNSFMKQIAKYPWIAQNLTSVSLIPKIFMEDNLKQIKFSKTDSLKSTDYMFKISGSITSKKSLNAELSKISKSMSDLYKIFNLDPSEDAHLLRNEYTTIEIYNYSGDALLVDNGQLSERSGLKLMIDLITGYHNEVKVYIDRYKTNDKTFNGSYINDSLTFDTFDDVPILIDTATLGLAKTANQRAYAESKLLSNQVNTIMDSNADIKDRFINAASLASNFSPTSLFGKFADEHDYYQRQKAEMADLALEAPSMTNQSNGNSFNIANNKFGIHVKYSKPTSAELRKIKKYYKLFGYELNNDGEHLGSVNSMSICNYVQFSGSWSIPNVDVAIIEMMKAQFENGVRLWHNNNSKNPMKQNTLNNKIVR